MKFRPKSEYELEKLEDEKLIEYAVRCRDAGDQAAFRIAIGIFVYKRTPMVRALVGAKVPGEDAEDLVGTILVSAISSISGISGIRTGEFVNWLKTIVKFRIADYHRAREGEPEFSPAGSSVDDDETWLGELVDAANGIDAFPTLDTIRGVFATRSENRRAAIELRIEGYSSIEAADEINRRIEEGLLEGGKAMTRANVDQLIHRFRADVSKALGWKDGK